MYKKLLPLVNKFICVRQGPFDRTYAGRLVDIDPECLAIQTYYADGKEAALWTVALPTITEFASESKELSTLALKVKWACSQDSDERDALASVSFSNHSGKGDPPGNVRTGSSGK